MKNSPKIRSSLFIAALAVRCRVSEDVVADILRGAATLAGECLAQGLRVRVPGWGTLAPCGLQRGEVVRAYGAAAPGSTAFPVAGLVARPYFRPGKRLRAAAPAPAAAEDR